MNQHDKEWKEEQSRIDDVLQELENKERLLETSAGGLKHDIIGLRTSGRMSRLTLMTSMKRLKRWQALSSRQSCCLIGNGITGIWISSSNEFIN